MCPVDEEADYGEDHEEDDDDCEDDEIALHGSGGGELGEAAMFSLLGLVVGAIVVPVFVSWGQTWA